MKHRILFAFAGFLMVLGLGPIWAQDDIKVPPRGETGMIEIKTDPAKAVAYLGGIKLGFTPVDTTVPSGRHTLTIILDGEELVNERVNVWPNQKTSIDKNLVMPYGSIELSTSPSTAVVIIDGEEIGATEGAPLTINNVEAGVRLLKVKRGSREKEMEVEVIGEQTVKVHVDLNKK